MWHSTPVWRPWPIEEGKGQPGLRGARREVGNRNAPLAQLVKQFWQFGWRSRSVCFSLLRRRHCHPPPLRPPTSVYWNQYSRNHREQMPARLKTNIRGKSGAELKGRKKKWGRRDGGARVFPLPVKARRWGADVGRQKISRLQQLLWDQVCVRVGMTSYGAAHIMQGLRLKWEWATGRHKVTFPKMYLAIKPVVCLWNVSRVIG